MCYLLYRERNGSFKRTNSMINRLMVLTINTGLATAVCTLLLIIFVRPSDLKPSIYYSYDLQLSVQKNVLTYVFFNFLISPLYCNSVMANLNSRDYIRGAHSGGGGINFSSGYSNPVELGSLRIASNKNTVSRSSFMYTLELLLI